MKQFSYIIKDEIGLHARPAGMLSKQADGDHGNGREARRQRGSHDRRSG